MTIPKIRPSIYFLRHCKVALKKLNRNFFYFWKTGKKVLYKIYVCYQVNGTGLHFTNTKLLSQNIFPKCLLVLFLFHLNITKKYNYFLCNFSVYYCVFSIDSIIYLQLCMWDDHHIFLIASLDVNFRLFTWWFDSKILLQQFETGNRWTRIEYHPYIISEPTKCASHPVPIFQIIMFFSMTTLFKCTNIHPI